jgi:peptide/nickel transport system substrate-binding protein
MTSKSRVRVTLYVSLLILACLWVSIGWAQQPKYGGTLRIALPGDPAFYNAHQGPAMGAQAFFTGNGIYNSLLTITPPPELKIVPDLAKSWEVLDDGRTYVFHLEEGVKFHDGADFDAQAAKWNIERIIDPEVKSWIRPYYEDVEQVEVLDKYTLRIRMKEPSAALPIALGGYFQGIPMASPMSFETYGKDWLRHPTGTGPYKFKEWIPGKHVILEKNPQYFKKGLPYIDTIEFRIMKDPLTASAALRAGEIDFISRVPMQQVPVLERSLDIRVISGPEMAPTIAFLNMRVKPFDDVRARRAVGGYGIDRGEIAKVAFQGRAKPLVSVLAPGVIGAIDLNEMYPYRPDEAKRLLKELGYNEKNPLKYTILIGNQDATMADVATLIKNQMAKIGVETKINLLDQTAVVDRVLVKHDFEMVVNNWATLRDINQRSVSFFKGRQSDYMGIDDPTLEAMVLEWRRTTDFEGRQKISAQMQRLIADQLYWVNVTTYPFFQAYRSHVKNYPFYDQFLLLVEQVWLEK